MRYIFKVISGEQIILLRIPSASSPETLLCSDPIEGLWRASKGKLDCCVFGVSYNAETGMIQSENKLITNLWLDHNFNVTDLEGAAEPLCRAVRETETYSTYENIAMYGAWVRNRQGIFEDLYLASCLECPRFSKHKWFRWLNVNLTLRHDYNIKERPELIQQDRGINLYSNTFYNSGEQAKDFGSCMDENFAVVPLRYSNNVCFITAHDRFSYYAAYDRLNITRRKTTDELVAMGTFSASKANNFRFYSCVNTYSTEDRTECFIYLQPDYSYGYECCCYGLNGAPCQENILKSINIGRHSKSEVGSQIVCAINEKGPMFIVSHKNMKLMYYGDFSNFLEFAQKFKFCELYYGYGGRMRFDGRKLLQRMISSHIESALQRASDQMAEYKARIEQMFDSNDTYSADNELIYYESDYNDRMLEIYSHNETLREFDCVNFTTWDYRDMDILSFRCVEIFPADAQCPFEESATPEKFLIKCCCIGRSFCNYERHALMKAYAGEPQRCKYSNAYQYITEGYLYPTPTSAPHTCLMHFATNKMLGNVFEFTKQTNKDQLMRVFSLPVSAFWPLDFSYALLQPNTCALIDVELNLSYMRTRLCTKTSVTDLFFLTQYYFPVRVLACRCNTTDENKPCDDVSTHDIPEEIKQKHMCARYSANRLVFEERHIMFNDASPFCLTYLEFRSTSTGMEYHFRSGSAINLPYFDSALMSDTIIVTMRSLGGDFSHNCDTFGKGALCFCKDKAVKMNERVCNNIMERIRALSFAISEEVRFKSRKFKKNPLKVSGFDSGPELCSSNLFFATIKIHGRNVHSLSSCARENHNFYEAEPDSLFCTEKVVRGECIMKLSHGEKLEENLICCCTSCYPIRRFVTKSGLEIKDLM